ncbi:hypothetical protein CHS0354_037857 [Potamilus streckersoni]|uniref:Uncharacterized protein n=1 Tax=Potamilus streckersoni TaxID=2493646 RepID=A0AAE0W3U3_9BIVA|nr:hypothetical protein CHS0354_037857 [Potamilus streckersoni]
MGYIIVYLKADDDIRYHLQRNNLRATAHFYIDTRKKGTLSGTVTDHCCLSSVCVGSRARIILYIGNGQITTSYPCIKQAKDRPTNLIEDLHRQRTDPNILPLFNIGNGHIESSYPGLLLSTDRPKHLKKSLHKQRIDPYKSTQALRR